MVSTVFSAALKGLKVETVQVEADVSNGLPVFQMVGYLASEVKEAPQRVRSAIRNVGYDFPPKKIVVNLSPADVRKHGTAFDLPVAVSVLASLEQVSKERLTTTLIIGELGLDGAVKKVSGVLPIVQAAKHSGFQACIVPAENQMEGEIVEGIHVVGVGHITEACAFLNGQKVAARRKSEKKETIKEDGLLDYRDIQGQSVLRRAVEVAVSGGHNLLMIGPPGVGKTMIARRIPTILPPLGIEERIENSSIYSIAGELDLKEPLMEMPPFREVHHSITKAALLGGGAIPKPGEISLANHGVLLLDELAEFPKHILELMRQPMDTHRIRIVRKTQECEFPAEFLMVATLNPCPCGNYPDLNKCRCTTTQMQNYWSKISSPLLDRMDICAQADRVPYVELQKRSEAEGSAEIRKRVMRARQIQIERYQGKPFQTNATLPAREVPKFCELGIQEQKMMKNVFTKMGLSVRAYHKILCVARTIADLSGESCIREEHLSEAISYRLPDYMNGRAGYGI